MHSGVPDSSAYATAFRIVANASNTVSSKHGGMGSDQRVKASVAGFEGLNFRVSKG